MSPSPQIFGGAPGSGFGSSSSRSLTCLGGGRNTVSGFFGLPFPLSFFSSGVQQSAQMSYSLPSISLSKQVLVWPHKSQIIISPLSREQWQPFSSVFYAFCLVNALIVEVESGAKPGGALVRFGDYTGKWTETVAISHNGPSDPDYFRLARDTDKLGIAARDNPVNSLASPKCSTAKEFEQN